jgi:hypothetical protein
LWRLRYSEACEEDRIEKGNIVMNKRCSVLMAGMAFTLCIGGAASASTSAPALGAQSIPGIRMAEESRSPQEYQQQRERQYQYQRERQGEYQNQRKREYEYQRERQKKYHDEHEK